MPFRMRYSDELQQMVEVELDPEPSAVDYPMKREFTRLTTQDGAVVIQRPLRDPRPRRWMWNSYVKGNAEYEALFSLLSSLELKAMRDAGLSPLIGIWEDVSGIGGFDRRDGSFNPVFTNVLITQVHREPIPAPGRVVYGDTLIEFVIEDLSYTHF
jgi:hypothetical protein